MIKLRLFLFVLAAFAFNTAAASDSPLNPNLANAGQLTALTQIDQALAEKLIGARPIASSLALASLLAASLDEDAVEAVLVELFVPLNLNTASRDEIMLVPGMSRRMAHEFEEYRPYTSIEQFRREIGKYVDDDEVARLEGYVALGE